MDPRYEDIVTALMRQQPAARPMTDYEEYLRAQQQARPVTDYEEYLMAQQPRHMTDYEEYLQRQQVPFDMARKGIATGY